MSRTFRLTREWPKVAEYMELRKRAGQQLPPLGENEAESALRRSVHVVTARNEASELIGIGRMVGDGVLYHHIVDVMVDPASEGSEAPARIVEELLRCLKENGPKHAEVTVIADLPGLKLYQGAGFKLLYPERYGLSMAW